MSLILKAYAKINLALDILGKRDDGYHEVAMIMQSIDLADIVRLTPRGSGITLSVDVSGLSDGEDNLAYRAAKLLADTYNVRQGVHIALEKHIPLAAGLAGGSTDAAAVLKGLNTLWNLRRSSSELERLAASLGSDVPFCLHGGTMLATGRGEVVSPLPDLPFCYFVLAKPPVEVSTAWVYRQYRAEAVKEHPDLAGMRAALTEKDLQGVAARFSNVLESVTIPAYPAVNELKTRLLHCGAGHCLMSGSGPTVFGLVRCREEAGRIAARLQDDQGTRIMIARSVADGEGENGAAIIAD
ncbi:4-diphosphocytidyl-2c-methyl-d-erythritol kinase [Lucifera butyrica]|uniref:4-diphosphocytidyl-2-C-methyl-D-erythritol kinase n=1 Tax=Lucifera butyrica TaxID=1351585 RepID=A0A498R5A1_9FIRM|nr:4-(cytidine 5'-diphospho)-2-C-methyl-D-erythritol kinase [Lucifera butyrica]VBB06561.1 4-diphosphocytidyl-2c-methyl-d-erythritol kinase [Lucifera butyrica]